MKDLERARNIEMEEIKDMLAKKEHELKAEKGLVLKTTEEKAFL